MAKPKKDKIVKKAKPKAPKKKAPKKKQEGKGIGKKLKYALGALLAAGGLYGWKKGTDALANTVGHTVTFGALKPKK